jgi:kanamycin kinase
MKRTEVIFDVETLPLTIKEHVGRAKIYDSSCSQNAKTFLVEGTDRAYLKISNRGSLERECRMTEFLSSHNVAPKVIAFEADLHNDYLFSEAVIGEDGASEVHIENPNKLACVFGEYLRMLHSLPIKGCPFNNRTTEMIDGIKKKEKSLNIIKELEKYAIDDVIIHGDYCLPNIIMDNFSFKGFIDLGFGGIGDRHYDIYWGIWTLNYNLKTDQYMDLFLKAYGRADVDLEKLGYFKELVDLSD